jgi:hypothetical protein
MQLPDIGLFSGFIVHWSLSVVTVVTLASNQTEVAVTTVA